MLSSNISFYCYNEFHYSTLEQNILGSGQPSTIHILLIEIDLKLTLIITNTIATGSFFFSWGIDGRHHYGRFKTKTFSSFFSPLISPFDLSHFHQHPTIIKRISVNFIGIVCILYIHYFICIHFFLFGQFL